ncbi:MAG: hypothetical protein IMF02_02440 [Proteobacteria bacterium]|nr:hypothetical protein [Pseudomonadota bacterium]
MKRKWNTGTVFVLCCLSLGVLWAGVALASAPSPTGAEAFPRSLESYNDAEADGIGIGACGEGDVVSRANTPTLDESGRDNR